MSITLSSQGGALEKARLLIDACNGLTKAVVGPARFYGRVFGGEGRGDNYPGGGGGGISLLEICKFLASQECQWLVGRLELVANVGRRNIHGKIWKNSLAKVCRQMVSLPN